MELKTGIIQIERINICSKSETDAAFLYLQDSESEKIKLRYKDSNPFSVEYFLPYINLLVECKGEIDPISGTFIIEEIVTRGDE